MSTTIEEIKGFLDAEDLKYDHDAGDCYIRTGFKTEHYANHEGRKSLRIIIELVEGGEFIKFMAPKAYNIPKDASSFHKMALFQTLLHISYRTKMVQFEYDPGDGEIRANIEFPLEDALLTQKQMSRCLSCLTGVMDHYHEQINDAIHSGITPESEEEEKQAFQEFQRQRREQRRKDLTGE